MPPILMLIAGLASLFGFMWLAGQFITCGGAC